MVDLAGEGVLALSGEGQLVHVVVLAGIGVLALSGEASATGEVFLSGESRLALTSQENPLGPGYGLTVGDGDAGVGAGFGDIYDVTADLREGDEFIVFLPHAGVRGMVGLGRVLERSASDEDRRQRLGVIQFTPFAESERLVPRLRAGDQVRVPQQRTVQHEFRRFERKSRRGRWRG